MPKIIWLDEVGSTNDAAKALIASNPETGTVICAKHQTNGRGQYGRKWLLEDGGSAFSVILKFKGIIPENLTVRIGECVVQSIEELYGKIDGIHIKLPNDVLINGKKICGILTEGQTMGDMSWVVCGIGIDVNCESISEELRDIATSLLLETGKKIDAEKLICGIQEKLMTL